MAKRQSDEPAPEPKRLQEDPQQVFMKAIGMMSGAFNAMGAVLGFRLGLFAALKTHGPCSPAELAQHAGGLDERFLLEWLGLSAASGLVTFAEPDRFSLSAAQATVLTDASSPMFAEGAIRMAGSCGRMAELLAESMRSGVGYTYDSLAPDFSQGMELFLAQGGTAVARRVLPGLPGGVGEALRAPGAAIADVGCGSGRFLLEAAAEFPEAALHGFELSQRAIERARANAAAAGLAGRVTIHDVGAAASSSSMEAAGPFDLVVAHDVIHDLDDPVGVLRQMRAAIKPGSGAAFIVDVLAGESMGENLAGEMPDLTYGISMGVCLPSATRTPGGAALGPFGMPPSKLRAMATEAGFGSVEQLESEAAGGRPGQAFYLLRA